MQIIALLCNIPSSALDFVIACMKLINVHSESNALCKSFSWWEHQSISSLIFNYTIITLLTANLILKTPPLTVMLISTLKPRWWKHQPLVIPDVIQKHYSLRNSLLLTLIMPASLIKLQLNFHHWWKHQPNCVSITVITPHENVRSEISTA